MQSHSESNHSSLHSFKLHLLCVFHWERMFNEFFTDPSWCPLFPRTCCTDCRSSGACPTRWRWRHSSRRSSCGGSHGNECRHRMGLDGVGSKGCHNHWKEAKNQIKFCVNRENLSWQNPVRRINKKCFLMVILENKGVYWLFYMCASCAWVLTAINYTHCWEHPNKKGASQDTKRI